MALTDDTKNTLKNLFDEMLDVLDSIEIENNGDANEEALKYADWMRQKLELRYGTVDKDGNFKKREHPTFPLIHSGIYWAYLGTNVGSEENKHRPVLLLRANKNMDQCTVIPLSTQKLNDGLWYHIDLTQYDNTALVEHMRVISKKRLDKPLRSGGGIATVNYEDMTKIYDQIKSYYATQPPKREPKGNKKDKK